MWLVTRTRKEQCMSSTVNFSNLNSSIASERENNFDLPGDAIPYEEKFESITSECIFTSTSADETVTPTPVSTTDNLNKCPVMNNLLPNTSSDIQDLQTATPPNNRTDSSMFVDDVLMDLDITMPTANQALRVAAPEEELLDASSYTELTSATSTQFTHELPVTSAIIAENTTQHTQTNTDMPAPESTDTVAVRAVPTKRKRERETVKRKRKILEEQKNKHPMLPPCACKNKCSEIICESKRKSLWAAYW